MVLWLISYLILHPVPGEVDGSMVDYPGLVVRNSKLILVFDLFLH